MGRKELIVMNKNDTYKRPDFSKRQSMKQLQDISQKYH